MDIRLRMTGHEDIDNVLRGLPIQVNHRLLQQAHAAAAKPLVEAEKLSAPEGPTGKLIDSIGVIRVPMRRASELGEVLIGPRRGGRYKGRAGHLLEYGTQPRYNKRGAYRGRIIPKPFARPSWDRTKTTVEEGIAVYLSRALLRYMRRMIKKHG